MSRDEKIKFCQESSEQFGMSVSDWDTLSDEALDEEVEWFDYLWEK